MDDDFVLTDTSGATLIWLRSFVATFGDDLGKHRMRNVARAPTTPAPDSFLGVPLRSVVVPAIWPSSRPSGIILFVGGIGALISRSSAVRVPTRLHLGAEDGRIQKTLLNAIPVAAVVMLFSGGAPLTEGAKFASIGGAASHNRRV